MTAKRDLKRLVRSRMGTTGEPYTAALIAVRGPDPRPPTRKGEPAVTTPHPDPEAAPAPEGMAIPILPARDIGETLAFFDLLGFTTKTYEDGGYGFVRRGGIELQYAENPDVDPFSTATMAYVRVNNVQALYDEFHAAGLWEPSIRGPELEAEMRRRWASGEPIARTVPPEDKPWGLKEFALLDPCNNLLRFGQPLRP